jgi:hypothetical protein
MLSFRPDTLWAGVYASALASRLPPPSPALSPLSPLMTTRQAEAAARALPLIGMGRLGSGSGGGGGGNVQLVTVGVGGGGGAVVAVGMGTPPARVMASAAVTARRGDVGVCVQAHPQQQPSRVQQQACGRPGCAACGSVGGGRRCWSCEQQVALWQRLDAACLTACGL